MSISTDNHRYAIARNVVVTDERVTVELEDGRTVSVPILWYPRLAHGTDSERRHWVLISGGEGIHWPDLDEDLSVQGVIKGRPSAENSESFQRWLNKHQAARNA